MDIPLDKFVNETPTKSGCYLWRSHMMMSVEMIYVADYPEKDEYGIHWNSYLGVPSMRGRNVSQLKGSFLKLEFV